jgi:hypothetical protein
MLIETVLGALTGLAGTIMSSFINYKQKKLEFDHEILMIEAQTKAMIEEAKINLQITKAQVEGAIELEDANVYLEAQKQGNKNLFDVKWVDNLLDVNTTWLKFITVPAAVIVALLFGFVDWLKGFMRPALTVYLVALTTYITYVSYGILTKYGGESITSTQALVVWNDVVTIIIYLTVSCTCWWFGDRRTAKFLAQLEARRQDIKIKE